MTMFRTVSALGLEVFYREAGDPAALKILRSVFSKGLEALAVETFVAAEQQGVTDQLFEALADLDQTPLRQILEAWIRTHVVHAPRRLHEVEEAERQILKAQLPVAVLPGVRALFERTCADLTNSPFGKTVPTDAHEVIKVKLLETDGEDEVLIMEK